MHRANFGGVVLLAGLSGCSPTAGGAIADGGAATSGSGGPPPPAHPVVLTPVGNDDVIDLAVSSSGVYWAANSGSLRSCAVDGCADHPTTLAVETMSTDGLPGGLALDGTSAYWHTATAVLKCPFTGCSKGPTTLASGQDIVGGVAVDGTNVYWTVQGTKHFEGMVMRAPIDGGSATVLATGQDHAGGIAVDATAVYWTTGTSIMKCAIGGCGGQPTTLASNQSVDELVVAGGVAYWFPVVGIVSCAVGGCDDRPTLLVSISASAGEFAVFGTSLYWVESGTEYANYTDGRVMRCTASSCAETLTTMAQMQQFPQSIAVNATGIYWDAGCTPVNGGCAHSVLMKLDAN